MGRGFEINERAGATLTVLVMLGLLLASPLAAVISGQGTTALQAQEKGRAQPPPQAEWQARIDPALEVALENASPNDKFFVIIYLRDRVWLPPGLRHASPSEKARYLKEHILPRQEKLLGVLNSN